MPNASRTLSVVIPCYNESESLRVLVPRTDAVLAAEVNRGRLSGYEILIVDNGSTPAQLGELETLARPFPRVRILSLSRNFGYQGAIWAGVDHAGSNGLVVMDGDGEDPPEVIPQFIDKWEQGFEVVYGVRLSRKVGPFLSFCYKAFYRILNSLSDVDIPLDAGEFSLVSGQALAAIRKMGDRVRMYRILRVWVGFRQCPVHYHRESRIAGKSKFNFRAAIRFAWDGFLSGTDAPVRLANLLSGVCIGLAILGSIYYLFWYLYGNEKIPGFASLNITLLFLFGMLFFCMTVISKYLLTVLDESRRRPPYIVRHSGDE